MVIVFLIFEETLYLFSYQLHHFTFPQMLISYFWFSLFVFVLAILMGVNLFIIVTLVCIFLMINDVEHFYVLVGHIYIFWGSVCSSSFPILKLPFLLNCRISLDSLDTSPYVIYVLQIYYPIPCIDNLLCWEYTIMHKFLKFYSFYLFVVFFLCFWCHI